MTRVVSARDVTDRRYAEAELREAQERFRSAFEHAPIGMALMSLDGELFRVNHAMVQILGRSTEELLRTTVGDLNDIVFAAGRAGVTSPAVVVVGEVVRLAHDGDAGAAELMERAAGFAAVVM